jgi:hypothetical protein
MLAPMTFDPTVLPREDGRALDPTAIAGFLASTTSMIMAELTALGDELVGWHPAPGEWCAAEVVGHVIEADRRGFGGRIRRILESPTPPDEAGWDQLAVAAARDDCSRLASSIAAEFEAGRADAVTVVRTLAPSDLERFAIHQRVGRVTVGDLLAEWVFHDRNHIGQLLKNAQARVWPTMGNTRRFTDPNA